MSTVEVQPVKRSKRQLLERRLEPMVVTDDGDMTVSFDTRVAVNKHFQRWYLENFNAGLTTFFSSLGVAVVGGAFVASSDVLISASSLWGSVGMMAAIPLTALPAAFSFFKVRSKKDKTQLLVTQYSEQVNAWLKDVYNIAISESDMEKLLYSMFCDTNKQSAFTDVNSHEQFIVVSGFFKGWTVCTLDGIAVEPQTHNALLKANTGFKESKNAIHFDVSVSENSSMSAVVQRKLDALIQIPLTAEKQYVVEKSFKDFQNTIDIAARLKLLDDPRWNKNFEASLAVIDERLSALIEEERENTYELSLEATKPYFEKTQLMLQ